MSFIRKHKFFSGIVVLSLLFWLGPETITYFDDPADQIQNRCDKEGRPDDPRAISRPGHVGRVLKIRLTDDGKFVDRCELTDVLYDLNWDSPYPEEFGPSRRPDALPLPKFVVLYVHGWKHSASSEDNDVLRFEELIARLDGANSGKKQVLGVYIGWNASSKLPPIRWFPFDNLTFWSKQTIADRIAQSGITTKIISAIGSVISVGDSAANQFVAIGHSFGARILFSATNQSLIYETQTAHPGYPGGVYKRIQGIANATILLNPAFEAARYTALDAVTRVEERFANDQLPLLLSVASDGDLATKIAFPVGQWLGTYRSEAELTTLGNYGAYQTHSLRVGVSGDCSPTRSNDLSESFLADGLCLTRDPKPHNRDQIIQARNPFLIAQTTSDIIKDHNDIWNPKFSNWLFAYINQLGQQHRPRLLD
jgi:hypothetical protein